MKIPKLFKKAAAFVMAAVTALSIMPATAFAAGDIGTIFFSHTYDSNGNAMRYNSSANIGGYTAGGTGNYKYRMFVDGENAFCIQPGVPLKTGNTLKKASSDTWNALSANQKKAVGLALLYGYQGNRNNLSGSDDEKWLATQTLVWEFVTGCREATGSYNQTSTTVYSLHFGSNYANSGARAVYDQIVAMLREHNTIPSFMSGGKNDITKELAYKDGKYSITLTDSNGVLSDYSFSSSDSNVSVSKSGNKLTISSTVAISGSVRITAKRNNVPTVSSSAKLIAYGDPNLQDLVTGVENADTVSAYINIETPTGTIALKKTSEDGVVEGISFTIKGDNFNKTVKTGKDGSVSVEGLFPGTYTVTEQSIDRYEPQKTQTVTLIGGKTSTVTFSNTLKRGSLEIVKTSEDNLVEGMKFHLYGTSLSGLPVDEYAVTDKNGLAKFENVLISGDTPYVVEEVDTAVRYVVPASQTGTIWNVIVDIHGAVQAIGLALLVLFFVVGVMRTCGNFAEVKRPEQALKLFIRFAIAKGAVTYGLELMMALFKIVQGMISTIMNAAGFGSAQQTVLPQEIVTAVEDCGFFESIPLWAVTLIGGLFITVLSFIMIMSVYGRFFKLYIYTAIAPVPLSAFAGEPSQSVGKSFIKSYAAVCLEGAVIVLACIIFSLFASSPPVVNPDAAAVTMVWSYIGELVFNMLVLVGAVKMADRVVREMMGL